MSVPPRVRYRERQRLRAVDLSDEQEYLVGLAGRHNIGVHGWGIVRGLALKFENRVVTIDPGMAVDGYGRELVLFETVRIEIEEKPLHNSVYLYYCPRSLGGCGSGAHTRWRDSAEITITDESWNPPPDESEIHEARASGRVFDSPAWPIFLGTIKAVRNAQNELEFSEDQSKCRFTRLQASRIVSPSRATLVRLTRDSLAEQYSFRVSVRNQAGEVRDRFVIDREGNPQFIGDLILTAPSLSPVPLRVGDHVLILEPKPAVGSQLTWRSFNSLRDGEESVVIELQHALLQLKEEFVISLADDPDEVKKQLEIRNRQAQLATLSFAPPIDDRQEDDVRVRKSSKKFLFEIANSLPRVDLAARLGNLVSARVISDREVPFHYRTASLSLETESHPAQENSCGCSDDQSKVDNSFSGIEFLAAEAPPPVSSRDIYLQRIGTESAEREELRLSLGAFAEGDFRRHLSFGHRDGEISFKQWLLVRGNGAVELPDGNREATMLVVNGTLTLPPVKPDPRDPLFKSLVLLSFLSGVASHGASPLSVAFLDLPVIIETQQDWQYKVVLRNIGLTNLVNPIGSEVFNSTPLPAGVTGLPDPLVFGPKQTVTIRHNSSDLPQDSSLTIQLFIGMETNTDHRKVAAFTPRSAPIPIVTSPSSNIQALPDEVPGGLSFPLIIKNEALRHLSLVENLKVEGMGDLPFVTNELAAGERTETVNSITIPTSAPSFDLVAKLKYRWEPALPIASLKYERTLTVVRHIEASFVTDPSPVIRNAPWTFNLNLKNVSARQVKITGLKLKVYLVGSPPPDPQTIPIDKRLNNNASHTISNLNGVEGPSGSLVRVEYELKYRRQSLNWEHVINQFEIQIT